MNLYSTDQMTGHSVGIFRKEPWGFPAIRSRSGKATEIAQKKKKNMTPFSSDPASDESTMNEVESWSVYQKKALSH